MQKYNIPIGFEFKYLIQKLYDSTKHIIYGYTTFNSNKIYIVKSKLK